MSIQTTLQYGILHLTIDRKERRNALTCDTVSYTHLTLPTKA